MSPSDYQNYGQPLRTSQTPDFLGNFSMLRIDKIFPKKVFIDIGLGDELLWKSFFQNFIFKILHFLKMCPILVGSVHNFGNSDGDIILKKCLFLLDAYLHGFMSNSK